MKSCAKAEVRLDDNEDLDEVCAPNGHLERMDRNSWFLEIGDVAVWLTGTRRVDVTWERREPGKWEETRIEELERENEALREALERFAKEWRFLIDIGQLADHGELAQAEAALAGNPCNKSGSGSIHEAGYVHELEERAKEARDAIQYFLEAIDEQERREDLKGDLQMHTRNKRVALEDAAYGITEILAEPSVAVAANPLTDSGDSRCPRCALLYEGKDATALDAAIHEAELLLAVCDLVREVRGLRCGVPVTYPQTDNPLDYSGDPVRRLWPETGNDRGGWLSMIARMKETKAKALSERNCSNG